MLTLKKKKPKKPGAYISHMPPGHSQSPSGDLEKRNDHEYNVQRHLKNSGGTQFASDYFGTHASKPGEIGECGDGA